MLSGKVIRKGGREREEEEGGREDLVDEEEGVKSMSVQNLDGFRGSSDGRSRCIWHIFIISYCYGLFVGMGFGKILSTTSMNQL